ncbi:hypothetical protein [Delftia acidovorans]
MPAPRPSVTLRRVQTDDVPMILAMEADPRGHAAQHRRQACN